MVTVGKTSILILSYNALEFTKMVVYSMLKHRPGIPFEVIIMDNGSTDGSAEWLRSIKKEAFPELKVVTVEHNLMFSAGNNVMRFFADPLSEYFLLLNNDVSINKDGWLEERIMPMVNDKTIGATGTFGDTHQWEPGKGGAFYLEDMTVNMTPEEKAAFTEKFKKLCVHPNGKIREITAWSMGTTAKLWDKLAGLRFDGKYKHMWSDSEYCIRVQLEGFKLALQPYNDKMTHFSGLGHDAIHNKPRYAERAAKIRHIVDSYEKENVITS